jgi:hypothetical protein
MEAKVKNWNNKAKLGYATMHGRVIKDELKRNGAVDDVANAKKCVEQLKKLDSLASGSIFSGGDLSGKDVTKVITEANACDLLLGSHIGNLTTASTDYKTALQTIQKGVNSLAQAGAGINTMVQQATKGKENKIRGVLVKRTQFNAAMDACMERIKALSNDIGKALAANNEKDVTKLMEKVKKMKHEYELLEKTNGEIFYELSECTR